MNITRRIRRAASAALVAAMALTGLGATAGTALAADAPTDGVAIDAAHFPDDTLRAQVAKSFDKDANGTLSPEEIANATVLRVSGANDNPVRTMRGIEMLPDLATLSIVNGDFKTADDLDLTAATKLTDLNLSSNTSLPTGKLDLAGKKQLTSLRVSHNTALTSIDVSGATALTDLDLSGNALTSLDVSHNTKLTRLEVNNFAGGSNAIASIDLSRNTALTDLDLSSIGLANVDLSHNTELTDLNLSDNALTELDLAGNTKLTDLNLSDDRLTGIDLSHNTALTDLDLSNSAFGSAANKNKLTGLDVSHNTALKKINLNSNPIAAFDATGLTALKSLDLGGAKLDDAAKLVIDPKATPAELKLDDNQLATLPRLNTAKLDTLTVNRNRLTSLDTSAMPALKTLEVAGNRLNALDTNAAPNLSSLKISGNPLVAVHTAAGTTAGIEGDALYADTVTARYGADGTFDVRKLAPFFDAAKVSDVTVPDGSKATFADGVVRGLTGAQDVTYRYGINNAYLPYGASKDTKPTEQRIIVTLHLTPDADEHAVTFDTNDGGRPTTVTVKDGKTVAKPADPRREGHTFLGWYTAAKGGSEFDFATPVDHDFTLFARWSEGKNTSYRVNDATFTWGVSNEAGGGAWMGGCAFLSAGEAGNTGAAQPDGWHEDQMLYNARQGNVSIVKPRADGTLEQASWKTRCINRNGYDVSGQVLDPTFTPDNLKPGDDKNQPAYTENKVRITKGTGTLDPTTNSAHVEWKGSFTIAFYGGMTYWSLTDPVLDIHHGKGSVTGIASGYGTSMENQNKWDALPRKQIHMIDLHDVTVTDKGVFAADGKSDPLPDYVGVRTSGNQNTPLTGANKAFFGSFPQSWVDYNDLTGQSSYWYSSGSSGDIRKAATAVSTSFADVTPVTDGAAGAGAGAGAGHGDATDAGATAGANGQTASRLSATGASVAVLAVIAAIAAAVAVPALRRRSAASRR